MKYGQLFRKLKAQLTGIDKADSQNETLQLVLQNIGDGVVVADAMGKVILFNTSADELIELSTKPENWKKIFRNELSEQFLKTSKRPDGFYLSVRRNRLPNDGIVVVVSDISALKEFQNRLLAYNLDLETQVSKRVEELQQTESQLRQLQKMDAIGTLAGGVAHDFNNILGAIQMYCELISDNNQSPETVVEIAEEIRIASNRGATLTRQLLFFSRKQITQIKTLNLNQLIEVLTTMLRRLIGENIEIELNLAPQLWSIKADPTQIEQVILNLAVNARDAISDRGTITLETANVNLSEEFTAKHLSVKPGPHVALTVRDTGCGMEQATLDRLFEPFFTTKTLGKGTGLGLSTTYGIIKQCQGTIWVYSEIDKGTVFKIYLPAGDGEAPVVAESHEKPTLMMRDETIFLVEDEEELRELFSEALTRYGYSVVTAANGREALEKITQRQEKIDLLVSDVIMPEMGGPELVSRVRSQRPNLGVLFMSGYTDEQLPMDGSEFIQKPFDMTTFVARVQEILEASAKNPN